LTSIFVCRLLNHMGRHGYRTCKPVCDPASMQARPLLNLTSGYIARSAAKLPKQGQEKPWLVRQNYILDLFTMRWSRMEDGILRFGLSLPATRSSTPQEPVPAPR